jgi:hypothetical protein
MDHGGNSEHKIVGSKHGRKAMGEQEEGCEQGKQKIKEEGGNDGSCGR